jgi:signal peptidase I
LGKLKKRGLTVEWRPNRWIAATLGFLAQPVGLLYVINLKWAAIYFVIGLLVSVSEFVLDAKHAAPWLQYFSFNIILSVVCSAHAYRIAAYGPVRQIRPWYSKWRGLAAIILVSASVIFSARAFLYEPFRFPSGSMFPSIKMGSRLIAKKWGYGNYGTFGIRVLRTPITAEINRGDIVVFDFPGDPSIRYVKRIIGIPGDVLEFSGRRIKINGKLIETSEQSTPQTIPGYDHLTYVILSETLSGNTYTVAYTRAEEDRSFSVTIPNDSYFVLGDNRDHSNDSRYWGFVPAQNIVGRVVHIVQ